LALLGGGLRGSNLKIPAYLFIESIKFTPLLSQTLKQILISPPCHADCYRIAARSSNESDNCFDIFSSQKQIPSSFGSFPSEASEDMNHFHLIFRAVGTGWQGVGSVGDFTPPTTTTHCVLKWGFTRTFPGNQDATLK
jgi:hypothetical protein